MKDIFDSLLYDVHPRWPHIPNFRTEIWDENVITEASEELQSRLSILKNIFKDKTCILFGAGPTLNDYNENIRATG